MIRYLLLIFAVCCLFSCRSVKKAVVRKEVPAITEGKLLKNIDSQELEYRSLYCKRLDVSLNVNGKNNNVKAVLKIKRDSFIWISATASLGIEVGRILLTPDSVKFVDTYHKKYFVSDYSYFYDKYGIKTGYECFQKLLTNVFFNLESCNGNESKNKKFKFDKTAEYYVLSNIQERAINRKLRKYFRKRQKNKEVALVLQQIYIDPEFFRPVKLILQDLDEDTGISATYSNFKNYEGKIFPENLLFSLTFDDNKIKLGLRFTKLEFDGEVRPNFRIPLKYKKMD